MKNINKKGISLIVLIITIIVVIILAAVVILTLSKNNPIESAKEARFKEDVRNFQDELDMYISKELKKSIYDFDRTSVNMSGENLVEKLGIPLKYKNKLAVKKGRLVYIGEDEQEIYWSKSIIFAYSNEEIEKQIKLAYQEYQNERNKSGFCDTLEKYMENKLSVSLLDDEVKVGDLEDVITVDLSIGKFCKYSISTNAVDIYKTILESSDKKDSYVGYYADIDDNGTVDGIIFVDLLTGSVRDSQNYAGYTYTLPQNVTTNNVKKYYIIQDNYTDSHFETHPVISPIGSNGERRFFVMSLNDFTSLAYTDIEDETKSYPSFNVFTWYNKGTGIDKNETSWNVGTGKTNTDTILDKWNNNIYGEHDNQDIWKHIKTKYNEDWFLPSGAEWTAFIVELRNYKRKLLFKIWTSKKLLVFYFI